MPEFMTSDSGDAMAASPSAKDQSVVFINDQVLAAKSSGDMSFVTPYLWQSLGMAVEDARSFLQGAEQVALVALSKILALYLEGKFPPATAALPGMATGSTPSPQTVQEEGMAIVRTFLKISSDHYGHVVGTAALHGLQPIRAEQMTSAPKSAVPAGNDE